MATNRVIYQAIEEGDEAGLTIAVMTELDMHVKAEALVACVRHGQLTCAKALIREGCDPCLKHNGRTALYWAVRLDHVEMLHVLLDNLLLLLDNGICLPVPRTLQLCNLKYPVTARYTATTRRRRDGKPADVVFTENVNANDHDDDIVDNDSDIEDVLEKRALFPDCTPEDNASGTMDSPSDTSLPCLPSSSTTRQPNVTDKPTGTDTSTRPKDEVPPRRTKEEKLRARAQRAIDEALFEAASHGSSKCIEILLRSHANPNSYFYHDDEFLSWSTPLLAACFAPVYCRQRDEGHEERYTAVVETLVRHGADLAATTCFRDTALHWAAVSASCPVVLLLLRNGADINRQNSLGRTPLICCLEHNTENVHPMVELLVEWGANLDKIDKDAWGALHYACQRKNVRSTTHLLESGAYLDSYAGRMNPLDVAVSVDHYPLVQLLLQWDARVQKSCVSFATETHNFAMMELLVIAGASDLLDCMMSWKYGTDSKETLESLEYLKKLVLSPLSLKQYTRLRLREIFERDHIRKLPLPQLLKNYVLFLDV